MFDEIIIRQDKRLRGKTEDELIKMLNDGIQMQNPNKKTTIIPSEKEAIIHAVNTAEKGSLIILCSDVVPDALDLVKKLQEEEANRLYEFTTDNIPNLRKDVNTGEHKPAEMYLSEEK